MNRELEVYGDLPREYVSASGFRLSVEALMALLVNEHE
jgi:hypothetical protein